MEDGGGGEEGMDNDDVYRPVELDDQQRNLHDHQLQETGVPQCEEEAVDDHELQRRLAEGVEVVDDDVGDEMGGVGVAVEAEIVESVVGGGKRKRGKKGGGGVRSVSASRTPAQRQVTTTRKKSGGGEVEEDVCFICFDGGNLVLCDRRNCPKAYHPTCVNRDEAFFKKKGRWNCGWHLCSICEKAAHFLCLTCTYSLCKGCIRAADFFCVRSNKGLCVNCMKLVSLIENREPKKEGAVDFDDRSSWEYLFKEYWSDVKRKLSLAKEEVINASNPYKGSEVTTPTLGSSEGLNKKKPHERGSSLLHIEKGKVAPKRGKKRERNPPLDDSAFIMPDVTEEPHSDDNDQGSDYASEHIDKSKAAATKKRKRTRSDASTSDHETTVGVPLQNEPEKWASKELLDLIEHMRGEDKSMFSFDDVQTLLLEYVEKYNLRDPKKKSQVICDARLQSLLGRTRVGHIEMLKLIESHISVKEVLSILPDNNTDGHKADAEFSQGEPEDTPPSRAVLERKRKSKKKSEESPHASLSDYAAVDVHNVSLIYLRRNLMEDLLDDLENFQEKVVGSFVRIRITSAGSKQDSYRLVQVVGTNKAPDAYKTGKRSTNVLLEILNLNKTETISIDVISNQEFTEEECKRLRQSIKCGLLSRLTVGEIQEKAKTLQKVKVNDWFETEILRLSHLRDRASEKGRKKELRECVEKLQVLSDPDARYRKLQELPEVHADPNMDPNYESEEKEEEPDDGNGEANARPRETSVVRKSWETVSPVKKATTERADMLRRSYSNSGRGEPRVERGDSSAPENAWSPGPRSPQSRYTDQSSDRPSQAARNQGPERVPSTPVPEMQHPQQTGTAIASPAINESDKIWHYCDPSGKVQGPFSLAQLRKWSTTGYFPADMKVWKTTDRPTDCKLLTDVLSGIFHKESVHLESHERYSQTPHNIRQGSSDSPRDGGWRGNNNLPEKESTHDDIARKFHWRETSGPNGSSEHVRTDAQWTSSRDSPSSEAFKPVSRLPGSRDSPRAMTATSVQGQGYGQRPTLSNENQHRMHQGQRRDGWDIGGGRNQSQTHVNTWSTSQNQGHHSRVGDGRGVNHSRNNQGNGWSSPSQPVANVLTVQTENISSTDLAQKSALSSPTLKIEHRTIGRSDRRNWSEPSTPTPESTYAQNQTTGGVVSNTRNLTDLPTPTPRTVDAVRSENQGLTTVSRPYTSLGSQSSLSDPDQATGSASLPTPASVSPDGQRQSSIPIPGVVAWSPTPAEQSPQSATQRPEAISLGSVPSTTANDASVQETDRTSGLSSVLTDERAFTEHATIDISRPEIVDTRDKESENVHHLQSEHEISQTKHDSQASCLISPQVTDSSMKNVLFPENLEIASAVILPEPTDFAENKVPQISQLVDLVPEPMEMINGLATGQVFESSRFDVVVDVPTQHGSVKQQQESTNFESTALEIEKPQNAAVLSHLDSAFSLEDEQKDSSDRHLLASAEKTTPIDKVAIDGFLDNSAAVPQSLSDDHLKFGGPGASRGSDLGQESLISEAQGSSSLTTATESVSHSLGDPLVEDDILAESVIDPLSRKGDMEGKSFSSLPNDVHLNLASAKEETIDGAGEDSSSVQAVVLQNLPDSTSCLDTRNMEVVNLDVSVPTGQDGGGPFPTQDVAIHSYPPIRQCHSAEGTDPSAPANTSIPGGVSHWASDREDARPEVESLISPSGIAHLPEVCEAFDSTLEQANDKKDNKPTTSQSFAAVQNLPENFLVMDNSVEISNTRQNVDSGMWSPTPSSPAAGEFDTPSQIPRFFPATEGEGVGISTHGLNDKFSASSTALATDYRAPAVPIAQTKTSVRTEVAQTSGSQGSWSPTPQDTSRPYPASAPRDMPMDGFGVAPGPHQPQVSSYNAPTNILFPLQSMPVPTANAWNISSGGASGSWSTPSQVGAAINPVFGVANPVPPGQGNWNAGAPSHGLSPPPNTPPKWTGGANPTHRSGGLGEAAGNSNQAWVSEPRETNLSPGPGNRRPSWEQHKREGDRFSSQNDRRGYGGHGHGGKLWNRPGGGDGSGGSSYGSRAPPQRVNKVCMYHESGHCKKGSECNYLHP